MAIVEDLKLIHIKTLSLFDLGEEQLDKTYGPGKWSIQFILHHLADAESVLYDRIRRTISNPGQVVWGFDQDAWAAALDYDVKPLSISRSVYSACREGIIYLAEDNYEEKGDSHMIHSGDGRKTLKDVFDKVLWHNKKHLTQIEQALKS